MVRENQSGFTAINSRLASLRLRTSSYALGIVVTFVLAATLMSNSSEAADTVWYQNCWTRGHADGGAMEPILPSATAVLDHAVQLREPPLYTCEGQQAQLRYSDSPFLWRISARHPELVPGNFPIAYIRTYNYYLPNGAACPYCGVYYSCNAVAYMLRETPYTPSDIKNRCGNTSNSYTIKLSADGDPAADGNLADVEPGKTASLKAVVYDQQNNGVDGATIRLVVDVDARSGGHIHDDPARHSQHMGKLAPTGASGGSVEQDGKMLTGGAGTEGLEFTFTAPAVSGDHKITATCTDGRTCTQEGPDKVWVGVKGLIPIPPIPDLLPQATYQLNESDGRPVGSTDSHPDNHYLTPEAVTKLWNLGFRYSMIEFPNYPLLHINDASLERGGLFDLSGNWTPRPSGHHEHRRGTVVDIRANGGGRGQFR
jgi:hypothetical protein